MAVAADAVGQVGDLHGQRQPACIERRDQLVDAGAVFIDQRAFLAPLRRVSEGVEGFRFNSAIAKLYAFVATIRDNAQAGGDAKRQALSALARLIAPFTPHLAEEAWTRLGEDGMILDAPWPVWDAALAADDDVVLPIQINGKRRAEIRVARGMEPSAVEALVLADETVKARLEGLSVKKIVVVKDRIVNLVAG